MVTHTSLFTRVAFGLVLAAGSACGQRASMVTSPDAPASPSAAGTELANGNARNAADSSVAIPCTSATHCAPASMDVSSGGFEAGAGAVLRGYIGQPVPWNFKGVDLNGGGRRVGVLLNNVPSGSTISPEQTGKEIAEEAKIDWTPEKKQDSSKDIEVVLRDLDRCEMLNADNKKKCSANKKLDEFDKVVKLSWSIADAPADPNVATGGAGDQNVVTVSDPNCGPKPTTNSDITGKVIQSVIGVAQGGIATLIPGLLSSILNKPVETKPTQC